MLVMYWRDPTNGANGEKPMFSLLLLLAVLLIAVLFYLLVELLQ